MALLTRLKHALGFHGRNWITYNYEGNWWTKCKVCYKRRMIPFGDYTEV